MSCAKDTVPGLEDFMTRNRYFLSNTLMAKQ